MTRPKRLLITLAAFLALPFLILATTFGPFYTSWVERRARKGTWGLRRWLSFSPSEGLGFFWMARSEEEARAALDDATVLLVDLLPHVLELESLTRLQIENPISGFAVSNQALTPITDDFSALLASYLDGEHVEDATLIVNHQHRLGLFVDAVNTHLQEPFPMRALRTSNVLILLSAVTLLFAACERKEGVMERAGKKMDKAIEKAADKIEEAEEKVEDAAEKAKKKVEKALEEVDGE